MVRARCRIGGAVLLTAAGLVGILHPAPAHADCADLLRRFEVAVRDRALAEVRRLERDALLDVCAEPRQVVLPRSELELSLAEALKGRAGGEREALLAAAYKPPLNWRAGRELGDHLFGQRRFAEATRAYEAAIETVKNRTATERAPSGPDILSLVNRSNQARMLAANDEDRAQAPVLVSTRDSSGLVGGGLSANVRGVVAKVVPVPIQFETGQAALTPTGLKAAAELLAALQQQRPPVIRLVGHTDERGAADFNLHLSERRVRAVEAYLVENGVKGPFAVQGKGESQPLAVELGETLPRELVWALNRRVEWIRE